MLTLLTSTSSSPLQRKRVGPLPGEGNPHALDQFEGGRTRNTQLLRNRATAQAPRPQSGHILTVRTHGFWTTQLDPPPSRCGQTLTNVFGCRRTLELLDCVEHAG
jgi:hypothetical protein